jgi:hypothetical protein
MIGLPRAEDSIDELLVLREYFAELPKDRRLLSS